MLQFSKTLDVSAQVLFQSQHGCPVGIPPSLHDDATKAEVGSHPHTTDRQLWLQTSWRTPTVGFAFSVLPSPTTETDQKVKGLS